VIGTETKAPAMPPISVPAVTATSTTTGCSWTWRFMISGSSRLPSICCTAITAASASRAVVGPLAARATRTATLPATVAPMIGTKPPRKVIIARGRASGTPSRSSASPMPIASIAAMATVPRL
jgi:hypothetical protein